MVGLLRFLYRAVLFLFKGGIRMKAENHVSTLLGMITEQSTETNKEILEFTPTVEQLSTDELYEELKRITSNQRKNAIGIGKLRSKIISYLMLGSRIVDHDLMELVPDWFCSVYEADIEYVEKRIDEIRPNVKLNMQQNVVLTSLMSFIASEGNPKYLISFPGTDIKPILNLESRLEKFQLEECIGEINSGIIGCLYQLVKNIPSDVNYRIKGELKERYAVFEVLDYGPGIKGKNGKQIVGMPNVLDNTLYNLLSSHHTKLSGRGVGLKIVSMTTKLLEGHVEVETKCRGRRYPSIYWGNKDVRFIEKPGKQDIDSSYTRFVVAVPKDKVGLF